MAPPPPPPPSSSSTTATTTPYGGSSSSISLLHPDILRTHILTRLDGPTLVSMACTSTEFNSLACQEDLWANICRSTWPSTDFPRMQHVISTFPNGPRSFFSASFPLLSAGIKPNSTASSSSISSSNSLPRNRDRPSELISSVDIYYGEKLIFRKVVETETVSGWFRCSPFRIDMLDPKETCPTPIPQPGVEDETWQELAEELTLSWILVDPAGRRAMNLSSHKPVSVQRHWLSGEVHARFTAILAGERGSSSSEFVQCGIEVTCGGGGGGGGGMHVREVSLQMEDMDGTFLNGKDSLGILHRAFEGKKGTKGRKRGEGKRRNGEFLEMKRERKERKLRTEGRLDMLCVAFGVLAFAFLGLFVLLRL